MMGSVHRQFRQVDVFAEEPFVGNPVAVVHGADGLADDEMRLFARWTNLSETTFLLPPTDERADYRVRIFTPTRELPFAGHPTLGSAHAWLEAGGPPARRDVIVQECAAGLVPLRRTSSGLAFRAPPTLRSGPVDEPTLQRDRGRAAHRTGRRSSTPSGPTTAPAGSPWSWPAPRRCSRSSPARPTWTSACSAATRPGRPRRIEVRAFFPSGSGTAEDPVTGSLNAALAQWLLASGKATAPYTASQGTVLGRRGRVHVTADADGAVWIGGGTHTLISGGVLI